MYCQFNEEEVIEKIFNEIGIQNRVSVEIGCLPGYKFSNTKHLMDKGWRALMVDKEEVSGALQKKVTPRNINQILAEANIPKDFDLLSIDIDGNDYWVWKACEFEPRVVIIEHNPETDLIHPYNEDFEWKGGKDYGAPLEAFEELAKDKGYRLYDKNSDNLFYIKISDAKSS